MVIGVLAPSAGSSATFAENIEQAFADVSDRTIQGLPMSVVRLTWSDAEELERDVAFLLGELGGDEEEDDKDEEDVDERGDADEVAGIAVVGGADFHFDSSR